MEIKTGELIIKYLEKNEWSVQNKGTMVKQSNDSYVDKGHSKEEEEEEYNPFT